MRDVQFFSWYLLFPRNLFSVGYFLLIFATCFLISSQLTTWLLLYITIWQVTYWYPIWCAWYLISIEFNYYCFKKASKLYHVHIAHLFVRWQQLKNEIFKIMKSYKMQVFFCILFVSFKIIKSHSSTLLGQFKNKSTTENIFCKLE